ncbi:hypothetical protein PILCRDRAFT_820556 [Piloderma croceum F 1598]|uniref:DUF6534 domain-containing protein n=1 Tax=Piloderma croceum (strain F 1598) TaxID=765440 RepID=A0A0C3FR78_PILCF|nr:hypothetical protein PILCRDRAFT_820556 [Piloderma croceum F 1598]
MSTVPFTVVPVIDLNNTVGALEIGVQISTFLFGILSCQTWIYYHRFPKDSIISKLLVALIWFLELGHTISVSHSIYIITVVDSDNPLKFISVPKSLDVGILFSAFIGPIVQAWFANRVRKLSGKLYVPIICWFLSFLRLAATIAAGVEALLATSVITYVAQFRWLLTFILAVGAAVDVIIAAALCFHLKQHRATSFQRTIKLINQTMIWTIETGLVTSVTAVVMLICFLAMQHNFVWISIFTFLAKLFSNSLLAALNARLTNRDGESEQNSSTFLDIMPNNYKSPTASRDRKARESLAAPYPNIAIEMSRTTEVKHDERARDDW